jgi:hypothetical protein
MANSKVADPNLMASTGFSKHELQLTDRTGSFMNKSFLNEDMKLQSE